MHVKSPGRWVIVLVQNLLFYPLLVIATLLYVPIAALIITTMAPFLTKRAVMYRVRRAISNYGRLVFLCARPFVSIEYRDLEPEKNRGPFIFVCNHRSASDPFLMACLPFEAIQIVNVWPFRLPIYGWFAGIAGYLSVHEMGVEEFFNQTEQLLKQGVCIISFPEGTRSGSDNMGAFTSSIFRVAFQNQAAIAPLAIAGNENIPPKGSLLLRPGRIKVHKLPALEYETYKDMSVFKLKNHVRETLKNHLNSRQPE